MWFFLGSRAGAAVAARRRHTLGIALALGACACHEAPVVPTNEPFWEAVSRLDLLAARERSRTAEERRAVDALEGTLHGGSRVGELDWIELGSEAADARLRAFSKRVLLDTLRLEGRWDALGSLRERHPDLQLGEAAIPAALLQYPLPTLEIADDPTTLPFTEEAEDHAAVHVELTGTSGAARVTAVLDTGAGTCVLAADVAERLGVEFLPAPLPVIDITGQRGTAMAGWLSELRFGPVVARRVPVAVLDAAALHSVAGGADFLVGWEILQHVAIEIAGAQREVVIRKSSVATAPDTRPNLVLLDEPAVRLDSAGASILLLLDTGAASTQVRTSLVERLHLATGPVVRDTQQGIAREREVEFTIVEPLELACSGVRLSLAGLGALDVPASSHWLRIDGTLGVDVAFAIRLVIDGPARRVEFRAR